MQFLGETDVTGNVIAGVIGIAGVAVGILLEWLLRRLGRIQLHFDNWRFRYIGQDSLGGRVVSSPNEAKWVEYYCVAEAFNSSDDSTGLRQIQIEFEDAGGRVVCTLTPRNGGHEVGPLNLPPKNWVELTLEGTVDRRQPDFDKLRSATSAHFVALTPKGKKYRAPIILKIQPQAPSD